ncbi:ZYRO0B00176p [Zygosaccharomyces rouxii]|uniref:ZYRO0B00176p n=1 Tax=Zygosaccharomyces rouxii (strain ATCC 2623 / CBS 732 / NBRC 1130 / NCYC 568 / NRRL Y-229) TaxID=559307 RepID=C5DQH2_ZYGRC|nr:uncharacterized protein ZYRO0B00176g [Zygosaccharomyces rouxii]KAH9200415.1 hypothetical protein LQ764DRAFT_115470 [Zygosaccharomyces rouxii]CAR26033.1 ZYRO0B00176p [Zygosaccharomyces rouxii]
MQMYLFLIFCALWALGTAQEFVPGVWRSHVERSHEPNYVNYGGLSAFSDSHTSLLYFEDSLHITFDNSKSWQTVDVFGEDISWVIVDQFHKERAFVTTKSGGIHVTEDQGRNWKQISLPEEIEDKERCSLQTHPFNTNFLLLHCSIMHGNFQLGTNSKKRPDSSSFMERIAYASDDAGKSFRRIGEPVHEYEATPDLQYHGTTCQFATSSRDSTLDRDIIYCIHKVEVMTNMREWFSHTYGMDIEKKTFFKKKSFDPVSNTMSTLFYTTDFGQSTKLVDELKDFSTEEIWIFPSHILGISSEGNELDHTAERIWVTTGGPFKHAHLPKGAVFSPNSIPELLSYDPELILLYADVEENEGHGKSKHLLVSDPSGLEFSFFDSITQEPSNHVNLEKLDKLKGTIWGRFSFDVDLNRSKVENMYETYFHEKTNWFQKIVKFIRNNLFYKNSCPHMESFPFIGYKRFSKSKISFDYGKTWNNLKVVDPSGKHKQRFHCDIDDVEHCSFQETSYFSSVENEPTAGILMKTGVVGENVLSLDDDDEMTFISRDGGASWEVVFEFPVYAAFLDFGNIIVSIPKTSPQDWSLKKFFYSVDQGNNWREYHLEEPTDAFHIKIVSRGSNVEVGLGHKTKQSTEYTFYTIDFSEVFGGSTCTDRDWETWYLSDGKCIDGIKYSFNRKKADAQCLMRKTFENLTLNEESCEPKDIQSSI